MCPIPIKQLSTWRFNFILSIIIFFAQLWDIPNLWWVEQAAFCTKQNKLLEEKTLVPTLRTNFGIWFFLLHKKNKFQNFCSSQKYTWNSKWFSEVKAETYMSHDECPCTEWANTWWLLVRSIIRLSDVRWMKDMTGAGNFWSMTNNDWCDRSLQERKRAEKNNEEA